VTDLSLEAFRMGTRTPPGFVVGKRDRIHRGGKTRRSRDAEEALLSLLPLNDAVSQLIYAENGISVTTVIVAGKSSSNPAA